MWRKEVGEEQGREEGREEWGEGEEGRERQKGEVVGARKEAARAAKGQEAMGSSWGFILSPVDAVESLASKVVLNERTDLEGEEGKGQTSRLLTSVYMPTSLPPGFSLGSS